MNTKTNANKSSTPKDTSAAPATASGGFEFSFEVGIPVPEKRGGSGVSKYDWSKLPAPKDPKDASTWSSAVIPAKSAKPLYTSIKKYQAREKAAGNVPAEFQLHGVKDKDGQKVGVRVYRVK